MSSSAPSRGHKDQPAAIGPAVALPATPAAHSRDLEDAHSTRPDVLEEFPSARLQPADAERALLNMLDDFAEEKTRLEHTQRAVLNILEDLDAERTTVAQINRRLQAEVEERKRAEESIRRYAEELKHSNQDLERFAYVASHDLQEPLRAMSSFSQLLAERYEGRLDSDGDEFIKFIVDGASRMQTLIQDLLAFSRVGTRGDAFVPVDCGQILEAAQDNLALAIAESGAVITHDRLPVVAADAGQLTQVFQNLLGNALKFRRAEEAPRVHVSALSQVGAWHFSVRDNGIGIDPRFFERIFIIFQRLHGRERYSGTGIGLAICKRIVERHGGRMWVESEPGKGSTFHFIIPEKTNP